MSDTPNQNARHDNPGARHTQRLQRAVGEAERAGLVSRVVPADELMDEAMAAAATTCSMSLPSRMRTKQCVNRAFESGLAAGVTYERGLVRFLFAADDQKEGMAAFVEKRKPAFKHR